MPHADFNTKQLLTIQSNPIKQGNCHSSNPVFTECVWCGWCLHSQASECVVVKGNLVALIDSCLKISNGMLLGIFK